MINMVSKVASTMNYAVTSVTVIVTDGAGNVLLSERARDPDKGRLAFVDTYARPQFDNFEQIAVEQVLKETGLHVTLTHLVGVFDELVLPQPTLGDYARVVQIVYVAEVVGGKLCITDRANKHVWASFSDPLKSLAFNHKHIFSLYQKKMKEGLLLPVERTKFADHYGTHFEYMQDSVVFFVPKAFIFNEKGKLLLAKRAQEPYLGHWDLPGGRMKGEETVETCLKREINEELNVRGKIGDLFQVYADKGKNPKYPGVLALYFAEIDSSIFKKNVEMVEFEWFSLNNLPDKLAFHLDGPLGDLSERLGEER